MWRLMPEINLLTSTFQASFDDQQETERSVLFSEAACHLLILYRVCGRQMKNTDRGKETTRSKNYPRAPLSTENSTRTGLGLKTCLRGDRQATSHLRDGIF